MAQIEHRDVQDSNPWSIRVFLREINDRLRSIADAVSDNRFESLSDVSFETATNGTYAIWLPKESFGIDSLTIRSTTAAGTASVHIDGVAVTGAPYNFTTSPVTHSPTGANVTPNGVARVEVVTAGLTGRGSVTLHVRRQN